MHNIEIKIKGPVKSGKTTIAYLIYDILKQKGFNVLLGPDKDNTITVDYGHVNAFVQMIGESIDDRCLNLKNKSKIIINEQN